MNVPAVCAVNQVLFYCFLTVESVTSNNYGNKEGRSNVSGHFKIGTVPFNCAQWFCSALTESSYIFYSTWQSNEKFLPSED